MIHHADDWLTIHGGDARDVLPELAADSVDCIVTSPPYWGLRDYGTATWVGGDEDHAHIGSVARTAPPGTAKQASLRGSTDVYSGDCGCGAVRQDGQLGLEATPEEYVANLVGVFRELRRVLKPSGTAWLNLGDSYAGGNTLGRNDADRNFTGGGGNHAGSGNPGRQGEHDRVTGLKPKDLVGIPWRVAFALQADGWWLRSDIIWAKPNPMPESVTDRPTKAHEYLFLLTKAERYYFDQEAVREAAAYPNGMNGKSPVHSPHGQGFEAGRSNGSTENGRNLRSVWTIATRPYPGAHFAVFPPELPERCIKAGSSERGVCSVCGSPWERVVERSGGVKNEDYGDEKRSAMQQGGKASTTLNGTPPSIVTTGWKQTCLHGVAYPSDGYFKVAAPVPAVVLDPFAGSGTVGLVANRLSRRAILIDLNPAYLEQQMKRNAQIPVGL